MSMDRCSKCSVAVDTDFDLNCYVEVDGLVCLCENCREVFHDWIKGPDEGMGWDGQIPKASERDL